MLHGNWLGGRTLHPLFTISLIIAMLALVGVFIEIPFVTNYSFWVLFAAYILLAGKEIARLRVPSLGRRPQQKCSCVALPAPQSVDSPCSERTNQAGQT